MGSWKGEALVLCGQGHPRDFRLREVSKLLRGGGFELRLFQGPLRELSLLCYPICSPSYDACCGL